MQAGQTPLHAAVSNRHDSVAIIMLDYGGDINLQNNV
jgi:hypothetical protein